MYIDALIFILGCAALVKASEYAVESIAHIARAFRMTEFVTSFILVALISALPETFISVFSALEGDPSLGLGTLLGSNIADLTLILGLVALAGHPIRIQSHIIQKDLYFAALTMLPIILGLDGFLTRLDAVILLVAGTSFIFILLEESMYFRKPYNDGNHFYKQLAIFFCAVIVLLVSANFIVSSAESLAIGLGIPTVMIGLFLIALGTTLPEFIFSLHSIKKGHAELAIGDILGVVVVDATLIIGITALVMPIAINTFLLSMIGMFTAFAVVFALLFMRSDGVLTKNEGMALVLFYVAFVVVQMLVA
ncbi:sodium:calcium antiporter [Candidatus Woesearchaeota archaeon]|nr:sodium:calcium antiporter [Candidatus Woesearchaeota archaeon]